LEPALALRRVVHSWVWKNATLTHALDEVVRSWLGDWSRIPRDLGSQEPIEEADGAIIIGHKPVVPVAAFGLTAPGSFSVNTRRLQSFRLWIIKRIASWLCQPGVRVFAVRLEINRLPRHPALLAVRSTLATNRPKTRRSRASLR
jgi:hypothetical protein